MGTLMKTLMLLIILTVASFGQFKDFKEHKNFLPDEEVSTASSFDPLTISNMLAWWKADVGITKDGSNKVTAWADQSGNGNTLEQQAATAPTWTAATLNGLPVLAFNAATPTRLRKFAPGIGLTGNPNIYVFLVAFSSGSGSTTGRTFWVGDSSGSAGTVAGASFEDESGTAHPSFRWNNGNERFGNVVVTSFKAYCFNFTTNYGSSVLYVNGSVETETSQGNPTNTVTLTDEEVIVGQGRNTSSTFTAGLTGQVAEIIVYGGAAVTLTADDIANVFSYLNDKYALY